MDRGVCQDTVHGATKSQTQLMDRAHKHKIKKKVALKHILSIICEVALCALTQTKEKQV